MSDLSLTDFQKITAERIASLLVTIAIPDAVSREIIRGRMPYDSSEETVVVMRFGPLEVWLYEDEPTLSCGKEDQRFEHEDYPTEKDLVDALVTSIEIIAERTDRERRHSNF